MNFEQLINQDVIKQTLIRNALRKQLPNSYLFCGSDGVGKWGAAIALASFLNCTDNRDTDSCGNCPSCKQIKKLQHPNLFIAIPTPPSRSEKEELSNYWEILNNKIEEPYLLITGARQMTIPVAAIRNIRKSLSGKAGKKGKRVIIIEQMERMALSTADALLKLIEEPPPETLIIITTSHQERLPDTIISRCREVVFGGIPEELITQYLIGKYNVSEKAAILAGRLSQGSLGYALYLTNEENAQDREIAKLIFKGIFISPSIDLVAEASGLLPVKDRLRSNRILGFWQTMFRDIVTLKNGAKPEILINIDFISELEASAKRPVSIEKLLTIPGLISGVMRDIELNVEVNMSIGSMLMEIQERLNINN